MRDIFLTWALLGWFLRFCCSVLQSVAVGRVLIDSEACHDRGQLLVEEKLEVVGRIIDVHCTNPDWLFAMIVKCVDRSGEAERRDASLLGMLCTSLVGTGEFRGRLRMVAYPEPGTGDYGLSAGGERLMLIAEQLDEKITVHTSNLPLQLGGHGVSEQPLEGTAFARVKDSVHWSGLGRVTHQAEPDTHLIQVPSFT